MVKRPVHRFLGLIALCGWFMLDPRAGLAMDSLDRLLARVAVYAAPPKMAELRQTCAGDVRCAAKVIAQHLGAKARLERAAAPDTDTIRMVETAASLGPVKVMPDGRRLIVLNRFGRKVEADMARAAATGADILLDLRGNAGGDFGRMLRVAGLLIGPRGKALSLTHRGKTEALDLPRLGSSANPRGILVLVGPGTASSAEVLAALLRRFAGAEILGARTAGKDYLLRAIPVDQNWRLLVPAERITVPGEILAGGLVPDRAMTLALLADLAL